MADDTRCVRCWADKAEHMEKVHGYGSDQWAEAWADNATCLLPKGHDGPHEWTPDSGITVEFKPVAE